MFSTGHDNLPIALLGMVLAFALAAALTPLGIKVAWRLDIVDRPRGNKLHARPTPLMGGVAMAVAFLAVALLWVARFDQWGNAQLRGLLVGCFLAALLGFLDEWLTLRPLQHFIGQILVVLAAIWAAFPHVEKLSNPFATAWETQHGRGSFYLAWLVDHNSINHENTPVIGIAFTVFWIVGMMNTVNFLDGLDGLAGGVGAIGALFLGLWSLVMTDVYLAPTHANQNIVLPLILCGAILGFLIFNWAPARVFMGDSGAMFIGFALGALSIFGPVKFGTWLLIMVVPIIDVAWAIVRRLMGRRSFASGDKHHIYHRMLELGLSRQSVVLIFYGLCFVLGIIDLNLYKRQKVVAFVIVAVLSAAGAVLLEVRGRRAESLARSVGKRADAG